MLQKRSMEYVIQEPKTENGVRYVPMTEEAACFRRMIANRETIEKYNKIYRVQMPKVTPHVCRHTFALIWRSRE